MSASRNEDPTGNGSPAGERGGLTWRSYRLARRIAVLVVGSTVLLLGIILLVTPGPAVVVIPIGLGILSLEFAWARHLLVRMKNLVKTEKEEK